MEVLKNNELEIITGGAWFLINGEWIWCPDDPEEPENPFES